MNSPTPTAQSIFLDAIENHSPEDWPALIASACGQDETLRRRVTQLLAAHAQVENFMARPAGGIDAQARAAVDEQFSQPLGAMIGPYKLLEQLGEGGMGVVYVAEQTEPVRRQVALKIIKPGMDTRQVISRFETERQSLALMDHPNIARILDAGTVGSRQLAVGSQEVPPDPLPTAHSLLPTASPRPYFVMELVRGLPITQHCDQTKLGLRARLAFFVTVCQAVQHAHQKGIIHRDLKPSNVIITLHNGEPVVKIIDFGVAKALTRDFADRMDVTSTSQMVGTPLYMSPEQAQGNRASVQWFNCCIGEQEGKGSWRALIFFACWHGG